MNTLKQSARFSRTMPTVSLIALVFVLFQTDKALAQTPWATSGNNIYNTNSGNVGVGTSTPVANLDVVGNIRAIGSVGSLTFSDRSGSRDYAWYGNGDVSRFFVSGVGDVLSITWAGNVGLGAIPPDAGYKLHVVGNTKVQGNVDVTGNIAAKYQDVAEWVPASRVIPAGSVVVLDPEQSNHVLASTGAYDTRVAGVVSASPGVILGEGGAGKVMVATTGRVRVKVDATPAPIRVGDLLVTSDKEGIAMRSQPLELGGTPIHRPGTLIGKALEPLEKGVGEILVLLSLQ